MKIKIKTVADVERFFDWLHVHEGLAFHPDESFDQYVMATDQSRSNGGNERVYTDDECEHLDNLMRDCFAVCIAADADIYDIGLKSRAKLPGWKQE